MFLQEIYVVEDCWNISLTEQSITNSSRSKITSIGLDSVHNVQNDNFILEFDGKGNGVLNIGSKNDWSQSTSNYRATIGIDSNRSDFYYAVRTSSTSDGYYGSSSINTYYHYKIVKEGHNIKFYVDNQLMATKSESFFTNYDAWSIYSIIWGSGTQTIKNIRIKAL